MSVRLQRHQSFACASSGRCVGLQCAVRSCKAKSRQRATASTWPRDLITRVTAAHGSHLFLVYCLRFVREQKALGSEAKKPAAAPTAPKLQAADRANTQVCTILPTSLNKEAPRISPEQGTAFTRQVGVQGKAKRSAEAQRAVGSRQHRQQLDAMNLHALRSRGPHCRLQHIRAKLHRQLQSAVAEGKLAGPLAAAVRREREREREREFRRLLSSGPWSA